MECPVKHTTYQVPLKDFKCPKCGATPDSEPPFYIIEPAEGCGDCEKLHEEDEIACENCGYFATGKKYAKLMMKKANMEICPCCKGLGYVEKKSR